MTGAYWRAGIPALMLIVEQEHSPPSEIDVGRDILAVAFSANGEYLVSGGSDGVQVYRVKDGEETVVDTAPRSWKRSVRCLAVSKDGRWIAAVTGYRVLLVWDATTCEEVFLHYTESISISGIDFSPDSTRLVTACLNDNAAIIWDVALNKRVQRLRHEGMVTTVKYSPQGDRIATATGDSVRVWDSNNRFSLLADIPVTVIPSRNTGLDWSGDNHLFVVSDGKIKEFETRSGSRVSQWPVHGTKHLSCIALPKYGQFVAYATKNTVTFWDVLTHTQLALIQFPYSIRSIALSPDDLFLAIGGEDGKIVLKSLSWITVSIVLL